MARRSEADARERGSRRDTESEHGRERATDRDGRHGRDERNGDSSAGRDGRSSRLSGARAALLARQQVEELLGLPVETISGLARHPDGFTVTLEVVEMERVPRTTDVLGTYRVELTPEGELDGYERVHRYYRNQAEGE